MYYLKNTINPSHINYLCYATITINLAFQKAHEFWFEVNISHNNYGNTNSIWGRYG